MDMQIGPDEKFIRSQCFSTKKSPKTRRRLLGEYQKISSAAANFSMKRREKIPAPSICAFNLNISLSRERAAQYCLCDIFHRIFGLDLSLRRGGYGFFYFAAGETDLSARPGRV